MTDNNTVGAYYNRTLSKELMDILKSPKYRNFFEYIKGHEGFELHFRNNEKEDPKVTLYKGRAEIFSINDKGEVFYEYGNGKKESVPDFSIDNICTIIKNGWAKGAEKERKKQYNDEENEKNEGYYQALFSRRYSIKSESDDPFIVFDKEFAIGGDEEQSWRTEAINSNLTNDIKEELSRHGEKCAAKFSLPEQCDYIGITKEHKLILFELKRHGDTTKIYQSPWQIGVYYKLLKHLIKDDKALWENTKKSIYTILVQKQKLGLIDAKWDHLPKSPDDIKDDIELAVVVGDGANASKSAKKRFFIVRDTIKCEIDDKEIPLYTLTGNGSMRLIEENDLLDYREQELNKNEYLICHKDLFYNDVGYGSYTYKGNKEVRPYILQCYENNLYHTIREEAIVYFGKKWHRGKAHTNSSQISCINHLFSIAYDHDTVLSVANGLVDSNFTKVVGLTKGDSKKYVAFEVMDKNNYLCEENNLKTQIDAIILAQNAKYETTLILFEWKYTEDGHSIDKSTETRKNERGDLVRPGEMRMGKYNPLIDSSPILRHLSEYKSSIYYYEPFYQLMRQTLWAEKNLGKELKLVDIGIESENKPIIIKDYLHVHVIPEKNDALKGSHYAFDENYHKSRKAKKKDLEGTWKAMLNEGYDDKYIITNPENLFDRIKDIIDPKLKSYLDERYWKAWPTEGQK